MLKTGSAEIMCHPGYPDSDLLETSGYAQPRLHELAILTDAQVKYAIVEHGINLMRFADL